MTAVIGASDRTSEFRGCALSYQQRVLSGRVRLKPNNSNRSRSHNTIGRLTNEFLTHARQLAKDVQLTQTKFRKLCLHLIDHNRSTVSTTASISNLVEIIQCDIMELNRGIGYLRQMEGGLHSELASNPQTLKHNRLISSGLEYRLAELVNSFQKILENNRERVSQQCPSTTASETGSQNSMGLIQSSIGGSGVGGVVPYDVRYPPPPPPPAACETNCQNNIPLFTIAGNSEKYPPSHPLPPTSSRLTGQSIPLQLYSDNTMGPNAQSQPLSSGYTDLRCEQIQLPPQLDQEVRQRDAAMKRVESTIIQMGEIYQQFSTIVQEQQDVITRIDSNTEETELNIDTAHEYLITFLHTVSARRAFMIKVFIAIVLCFMLFAWLR